MANDNARIIILKAKHLMQDCASNLKEDKLLKPDQIIVITGDLTHPPHSRKHPI